MSKRKERRKRERGLEGNREKLERKWRRKREGLRDGKSVRG